MGTGETGARRIALIVQYDGTDYKGWQIQDNGTTIQGLLENALNILTKEDVRVTASGRTDSGVHALGQVVHFDISSSLPLDRFCIGLNGILPRDISVQNAFEVDHSFHARYSAVEREYLYRVYNRPTRSAFMQYRAMWVNFPLDLFYVNESLEYLVGEKDFASFCKKKSADEGTIRKIISTRAERDGDFINIIIVGNAFLHNMIRIIVGTIIENHRYGRESKCMIDIIRAVDRDSSGVTAPAYGLYLNKITYDPPLEVFPAAFSWRSDNSRGR